MENNNPTIQDFGIKEITQHLTLSKADIVCKETKRIVKEQRGSFNIVILIDCLEAFIRERFHEEPEPRGLAKWFARQYEYSRTIRRVRVPADGRVKPPPKKKPVTS
jgi:hypothetical protein